MYEAGYITLTDGPGARKRFYVQRAPTYIRAVSSIDGKWDILDLLEDEPTPQEEIHIYKQLRWAHVRGAQRRDSGLYYDYIHVAIEPEKKATLRYNHRWREWATLMGHEDQRRKPRRAA